MDSEFISLEKVLEEVNWLQKILEDIHMWEKQVPTLHVHYDSQSAKNQKLSNMYNDKSRHISRRHKTIKHLISTSVIIVDYIKWNDNLYDPFNY